MTSLLSPTLACALLFALIVPASRAQTSRVQISNNAGFQISYDGNNGLHSSPLAGAAPPANAALQSSGSTAIGSSQLVASDRHFISDINDGLYGNQNSWISENGLGGSVDPDPWIGVAFPAAIDIRTIAFGRDNGDDIEGVFTDRAGGAYTLQFTRIANPNNTTAETENASTGWKTIGAVNYLNGADSEAFSAFLRHEFKVTEAGRNITATGVRIKVSSGDLAIDELEVHTPFTQTITFDPPDRIYGPAPFGLVATSSSTLPVAFSLVSGPATLSGDSVTLTGGGTVVIRAAQDGNTDFAPVSIDRSFNVTFSEHRDRLVHQWTFNDGTAEDYAGSAHGTLNNGALISNGQLRLDGIDDYMQSATLDDVISEKTLVVWLTLPNLTQAGGGALTMQSSGGDDFFDSIVFGELLSRRWMAGSDDYLRTQVAGQDTLPAEASTSEAMLAIAYGGLEPNSISIFRNGELYTTYVPATDRRIFIASATQALIGLRSLDVSNPGTADGFDSYLAASVNEARIYNRALVGGEIQAIQQAGPSATSRPIITSPAAVTFIADGMVSFTVAASGHPAPSLTFSGDLPFDFTFGDSGNGTASIQGRARHFANGVFTATITAENAHGSDSQTLTITVNVPSRIGVQPLSQSASLGQNVTFSVAAPNAMSFTWHKRTAAGVVTVVPGQDGELFLNNVGPSDAASYYANITFSDDQTEVSEVATLTILGPRLLISRQAAGPVRLTFNSAAARQFAVQASDTLPAASWTNIGPAAESSPGVYEFTDVNPQSATRFYKIAHQ